MFKRNAICSILWIVAVAAPTFADELLYRYEGDVLPYDKSAGWSIFNGCDPFCSDWIEDGKYVTQYTGGGGASYNFSLSILDERWLPPPTLWVEWRFRSNQPIPMNSFGCDARFRIVYLAVSEIVFMFSDSAVSFSGDDFIFGLDPDEFHTYRFESADGLHYTFAVDGLVFIDGTGTSDLLGFLQFGRSTSCGPQYLPVFNEWDMIRYGTISKGERVIDSDPPSGFIDARIHPQLDRIAVTFNEPNFVYIDQVTVKTTGGSLPVVIQTTRREKDEPDTLEIVLDRPISPGRHATVTISDGAATNVLKFSYAPGDTNGDGDADLHDLAALQNCFGDKKMPAPCPALDMDEDGSIRLSDIKFTLRVLSGPL